jgi:hypothetical protein
MTSRERQDLPLEVQDINSYIIAVLFSWLFGPYVCEASARGFARSISPVI